jgi:RNA polymerase sigma-70 factor (ECF subfamily)
MSQGPQTRTCSDEELVGLVQGSGGHKRRDHAEILLRRYQDWIVRGCARIVRDPEDAADCAQEVLLKLYRLIETYRGKGSVAAWVHSIIRSVCLDALGRRHRDRSGVRSLPADLAELSAPGGGPVAVLASREKNQIVRTSVQCRVTSLEASVLYLYFVEGWSLARITEILNLDNDSGARSHLARAKRKLKACCRLRSLLEGRPFQMA